MNGDPETVELMSMHTGLKGGQYVPVRAFQVAFVGFACGSAELGSGFNFPPTFYSYAVYGRRQQISIVKR
jgi:hypothetical protein